MEFNALTPPPLSRRRERRFSGGGALAWLFVFFGCVAIANVALVYYALHTMPGGELENAYDASQSYNARIAEARLQSERGWQADIDARAHGDGVRLVARLDDRLGRPVEGLAVTARLEHPSNRLFDRTFALEARGAAYEGVVDPLSAGQWTIVLQASKNGQRLYETRNRFTLMQTAPAGG